MAPGALLDDYSHLETDLAPRPSKKTKVEIPNIDGKESEDSTVTRRHPLGVRPAGNSFLSDVNLKHACGTLSMVPDETLALLLEYLDPIPLLRLGGTCRALHAFTRSEELWRAFFTESPPVSFSWRGTWRSTYLSQSPANEPRVNCSDLFSDVLHRPFFCAHVSLDPFVTNIPVRNRIQRITDSTADEVFSADRPLILTQPVTQWQAYKEWSVEYLLEKYHDVKFRAEAVDWPFSTYVSYMRNNHDESPLYLFDRSFAEKMAITVGDASSSLPSPTTAAAYSPPSCFGVDQDLFSVLGPLRPAHRWLIVGPARSGSTFHKDPNGTCAWNGVLRGRKYWIMFPSSSSLPPPPGVFVSADQSEVTSPLSIAEWLLTFHAEARATDGCQEGICEAGELLYVPAEWYHLVVNLEESVALTQNFVPRGKLADVLSFLKEKRDQVSGFNSGVADPYEVFVRKLRENEPVALEEALAKLEKRGKSGRGRWEEITKVETDHDEGGGFSFGFGGDEEEEEIA